MSNNHIFLCLEKLPFGEALTLSILAGWFMPLLLGVCVRVINVFEYIFKLQQKLTTTNVTK